MLEVSDDSGFPVIDIPTTVDTAATLVQFLVAELVRAGSLPADYAAEVTHQVWQRERLGSTAISGGVAIPHAQIRAVARPIGVVGRCTQPLDWPGALDGGPVGLVCLLVVQAGSAELLFREFERLTRQLRSG